MSKEDSAPGLLSKMVRFVRNPGASAPNPEAASASKEEAMSRQLLKEMMERKRQNDFVRKREFDLLRKLRKRESPPNSGGDVAGRPSFFQSSMMSRPDDRAITLKKIDEIEAQMSMQWWKNKEASSSGHPSAPQTPPHASNFGTNPNTPSFPQESAKSEYRPTVPIALQMPVLGPTGKPLAIFEMTTEPDLLRTQPAPIHKPTPAPVFTNPVSSPRMAAFVPAPASVPQRQEIPAETRHSSFSESKMTAMQVEEFVANDAELEEAAIRFANGDDAGAELGIQALLAPGSPRALHIETWLSLFDLYRATAQADKFDQAALQFAEHFGRSAPQWFSMPAMVKALTAPASIAKAGGNGPAVDWICPSVVGLQTIAALRAALGRATMPWRLDWSNLKSMDEAALPGLLQIFAGWASQPVQLRFIQARQLQKTLLEATPVGDTSVNQERWQLRLQALRIMNLSDEFELVALDFCMTYELSPPAWSSPSCDCKVLEARGDADPESHLVVAHGYRDSTLTTISGLDGDSLLEAHSSMFTQQTTVELSGQIHGDAVALLDEVEAKLMGADTLVISCAKLIRVDFSAAGELLNWVSARQSENRTVQFIEVHRLVAAFFNVMGIAEHARVVIRRD